VLVILQFGTRAGDVVDFLPHEARAMLQDGRAVAVESVPRSPVTVVSRDPVVAERRAPDRGKRRGR
jgi:hypothetical protein